MTTHRDLLHGQPSALETLAAALTRHGIPDDGRPLRDRVKNWQKKTGRTPTGAIWPADWAELTANRALVDEDDVDQGTNEDDVDDVTEEGHTDED